MWRLYFPQPEGPKGTSEVGNCEDFTLHRFQDKTKVLLKKANLPNAGDRKHPAYMRNKRVPRNGHAVGFANVIVPVGIWPFHNSLTNATTQLKHSWGGTATLAALATQTQDTQYRESCFSSGMRLKQTKKKTANYRARGTLLVLG